MLYFLGNVLKRLSRFQTWFPQGHKHGYSKNSFQKDLRSNKSGFLLVFFKGPLNPSSGALNIISRTWIFFNNFLKDLQGAIRVSLKKLNTKGHFHYFIFKGPSRPQ